MALSVLSGTHHHNQTIAADTWVITHNLNTESPIVDCWLGEEKVIPQSVVATSAQICTITFQSAQLGEAILT